MQKLESNQKKNYPKKGDILVINQSTNGKDKGIILY